MIKTEKRLLVYSDTIVYSSIDNMMFYHRIDGPAYIKYCSPFLEEIKDKAYWLYDERFRPWWIK